MEIRSLKHTDFDTLFRGFEKAFADYEIHFEREEVRSMLKRRGFNPELSFAAFDNDDIVAFTLNGTGVFNGIPTAYDTGTGTVGEYRGQGIAGKIFTYSIPFKGVILWKTVLLTGVFFAWGAPRREVRNVEKM